MLRVAVYVNGAYCESRYIDAVSGHVQIALKAADILSKNSYDVTLITTKAPQTEVLPDIISADVRINLIQHVFRVWPSCGACPQKVVKHYIELVTFLRKNTFDIVHCFGFYKTGLMLSTMKLFNKHGQVFFTPYKCILGDNSCKIKSKILKHLCKHIDAIITTNDYVNQGWKKLCRPEKVFTVRPGILKQMKLPKGNFKKNTVLFWRQANYQNGADIALDSYEQLAPKHPNIDFVFAVREQDQFEKQIIELANKYSNVNIYTHPYKKGITLEKLLAKTLFVVHPFRCLSLNPQICILETLYSGVPVITTDIECNKEIINNEVNGLLIKNDDSNALTEAIEKLLHDRSSLDKISRSVNSNVKTMWNWRSYKKGLLDIYRKVN